MHIRCLEGAVGPTKTGGTTKLSTSTVGVASYARAHKKAPLGSISRRLDDMLSTSFDPHIISYKPPRRFLVPKFTMYNGTSDPFDHLLHYRQLMTLDIGNDVLLCKAFPASLHDDQNQSRLIRPRETGNDDALTIKSMDIPRSSARTYTTCVRPINEPITFPSIDSNWVILLRKDALILTLRVINFDVRKILVDPRSSVDLLQMSTYRQMCERLITIQHYYGMGMAAQNEVIPSTYHQMVSYLIESGQVDLLGSQLVAQQCYQVTVKVGQIDLTGDEPESSSAKLVAQRHGGTKEWRNLAGVCVDYTNLNETCLKDSFPLPQIDQIVDSMSRNEMLFFLDIFSSYHQIPMCNVSEADDKNLQTFDEKNNGEDGQKFVYYVSKALVDTKTQYSQVEYTTLALHVAIKKLRSYFQAHQLTILTNQSLRITLHKPDLFGQMMKWAIELSEYDIQYKPFLSLKGHILVDFIAKLP
ncbi:hypothetical protein CK203_045809 [Vitis vinifera]|uniref:Reverse transcriptase RNase H-like domain-containing protein n=1 Tax=Vitis vinifera TaxID=29760 RepID=A0A438FM22_VITVI|nr:hypothetical protein CK203_045809 [Vitis vinifera]